MNEIFKRPIRFLPSIFYEPKSQSFTDVLYTTLMYNSMQLSIQQVQLIESRIEEIFNREYDKILKSYENSNEILSKIERLLETLW